MAKIFKKVGKNKIVVPLNFEWPREPFVFLDASGSRIVIEEHVTFGSGVVVSTHSHHFDNANWQSMPGIKNKKPTVFKERCFIGMYSIILYKCKIIGQHSVVGAGSVVTCNIPPYEIWAGNPAKKIGDVKK